MKENCVGRPVFFLKGLAWFVKIDYFIHCWEMFVGNSVLSIYKMKKDTLKNAPQDEKNCKDKHMVRPSLGLTKLVTIS